MDGGENPADAESGSDGASSADSASGDAWVPSPTSCPETVDDLCAADGGIDFPCVRTYAEAQSDPWPWIDTCVGLTPAPCQGYEIVTYARSGGDQIVDYFYDANSGMLVGVRGGNHQFPKAVCLAGPPTFTAPDGPDCPSTRTCDPASVDAGQDSASD